MLNSIHLNDKSYQELFDEALSQISICSGEWTNYNPSDPGITLLENLTAFNFLQQNRIDEVTDDIRLSLLKLLGHQPSKNSAAKLLIKPPADDCPKILSAQYSIKAGSVNFETENVTQLYDWSVSSIYSVKEGTYRDITYLLDSQTGTAAVFGNEPDIGDALCLILKGSLPENGKLLFWVEAADDTMRNPFPENMKSIFGCTRWQLFSESGWSDVDFTDDTHGFLQSGAVTIDTAKISPALCDAFHDEGFALRCILTDGSYDIAPRIAGIAGNLFPVSQRETVSRCFSFDGADELTVQSALAVNGAVFVYCREPNEHIYRAYREYPGMNKKGRFYTLELTETGAVIRFDRDNFGFAPDSGKDAIKVVCCTEDMVHHRSLGTVFGYDDQIIDVDFINDILPDCFSLIAEIPDNAGGSCYKFIFPGKNADGEISYELLSHAGMIKITDPGIGTEYRLFVCDCAFTTGVRGAVRKNSILFHTEGQPGFEKVIRFTSPAPAIGGSSWETPEQLRLRFARDMRQINTAVTADDYKFLAKNTPALCIHKVTAWSDSAKNTVSVVVKPRNMNEKLPKLSEAYQNAILRYLNERRMITTRIELLQPRYLPINVTAALKVKRHYRSVEDDIKSLLTKLLDHVDSDADFGGMIRFDEIYRALSDTAGVSAIEYLRLIPDDPMDVTISGNDIILPPDALCHIGNVKLELRNDISNRR